MKSSTTLLAAAACAVTLVLFSVPAQLSAADLQTSSPGSGMPALEQQFRELPLDARRQLGPLFWLHGDDSKERLEMYVGKVAEGGNGCFTTESRPHNDWLGEGWWRDLSICLDAAKQQGCRCGSLTRSGGPARPSAGRCPRARRLNGWRRQPLKWKGRAHSRRMAMRESDMSAQLPGRSAPTARSRAPPWLTLRRTFTAASLSWQAPAGKWRVFKFTHKQAPGLAQQGGSQLSVDGASKDCVDWFLQTVYQPHFEHYGAEFGKTIRGFFYDEPETPGDWGTELNRVLAEWNVDWKKAYVAYKSELAGEEQVAARYQYLDAFAETWGRTMYGGIAALVPAAWRAVHRPFYGARQPVPEPGILRGGHDAAAGPR